MRMWFLKKISKINYAQTSKSGKFNKNFLLVKNLLIIYISRLLHN